MVKWLFVFPCHRHQMEWTPSLAGRAEQSLFHSHLPPTAPPSDLRRPQRVLRPHEKLGNYVTWPAWENWNVFQFNWCLYTQSLATNSPAPWPEASPASASGTRSYETTSRDQRGKIEIFFFSTGACTAAKSPIANHQSQINAQLYSAPPLRHFWQQCHSDSEFDAL